MTNPLVFSPPLNFGDVLSHLQLNALDVFVSQSINGVTGGVIAPAAPIVIGGSGLQVTGDFQAVSVSSLTMAAASSFTVPATAVITLIGNQIINSGAVVQWQNGSFLTMVAGSTATFSGSFTLGSSTTITHAARSYTRGAMGLWSMASLGDYWNPSGLGWQQTTLVAGGPVISFRQQAPPPCTITAARMRVQPAAHALLPIQTARFKFAVVVFDPADPETTASSTLVLDTTVSTAAYDAEHDVELTGLSISVPDGYVVVTQVVGESLTDANTVVNGIIWPPRLTFTRLKIGEE